jgi:hypothetical protein
MLLSSGKSRGFLSSLVRFGFTGSDVVDGAEDCNCSGICGKPVVTPEIGLLPGSRGTVRNILQSPKTAREAEGGIDTLMGCMDGQISSPAVSN